MFVQYNDFTTLRVNIRWPVTGEPLRKRGLSCDVYCSRSGVETSLWMDKQHSIWELARLNLPDIACYAIQTLAACQRVLKATKGVLLHTVSAWFTHLSRSVGPFWFILMRPTTIAHTHIRTEQSKILARVSQVDTTALIYLLRCV